MRYLFDERLERSRGGEQLLSASQQLGVVPRADLDIEVWNPGDDVSHYKRAEMGDFVISLRSFQGGLEKANASGILSPAYTVLRPRDPSYTQFYRWYLKSPPFVAALDAMTTGIRQGKTVQWKDCREIHLPFPPISRACAIADFLDRECERVSLLKESVGQVVSLAREQARCSLEAELSDDRSAFGGVKLGWYCDVLSGYAFASNLFLGQGEGVRLLRGVNVGVHCLRWEDVAEWPLGGGTQYARWQLAPGDLVLGLDRPWINAGLRLAEVQEEDLPALLLQRVARLRGEETLLNGYIAACLDSDRFRSDLAADMTGISVPHISSAQVASFRVPRPPVARQEVVVETRKRTLDSIAKLEHQIAKTTTCLDEYRTSLITEAVTGQLDVTEASEGLMDERLHAAAEGRLGELAG